MIVGRRTNVDFYADNDLSSEAAVLSMAKRGELFQADAEDYFIYSRGSRDWDLMPRFVVGRRAYDNWLADNAFHDNNVDLLDATGSIVALHLTTADGNKAGFLHEKDDKDQNIYIYNPVTQQQVNENEWDHPFTHNDNLFSRIDKAGNIHFFQNMRNLTGQNAATDKALRSHHLRG